MIAADLAVGHFAWYRGIKVLIIDVRDAATPLYQIRLAGGETHWTTADRLTPCEVAHVTA